MAASPCGGRRPPCRWQSDAGNPSRHRPGEGRPGTSARRPAGPRREAGHFAPPLRAPAPAAARAAPPRLRWLQNDGKAARPAVHRRDTHARPPCHTVTPSRGAGPPRVRRVAWWVERGWPSPTAHRAREGGGPGPWPAHVSGAACGRGGRRFLSQHLISGARRLSASAVSTRGLDVRLVWF